MKHKHLFKGTVKERREQMEAMRDGKAEIKEFEVLKPIAGKVVGEVFKLLASKALGVPLDRHWHKYARLGYIAISKSIAKSKKKSKSETKSEE